MLDSSTATHPKTAPAIVPAAGVLRYPQRYGEEEFYPLAYRVMVLSRRFEERLDELFKKGYVKGTVTLGIGNEATAVGMAMPFRPGEDVLALLHRDFASHMVNGATPYQMACQYIANADSPTHGREGNVHHGDAARRRYPMMSHLGKMLSPAVGAVWAARRHGEEVFGLGVIGDGGASTGEFHEALNIASVHRVPVLFLIENNYYAFSTPIRAQYHCRRLSDRAVGYGVDGQTIDGTDVWQVYTAVCDALEAMAADPMPRILECMTLRLRGHAAYDKADYVTDAEMQAWLATEPVHRARGKLQEVSGWTEEQIGALEEEVEEELQAVIGEALKAERPQPRIHSRDAYAGMPPERVKPFQARKIKNGEAVKRALDYLLSNHPRAFMMGLDIGPYGSAFKTCKGLVDRHGPERVIDMPLCESGIVGMALGSSQVGGQPIIEFQFADFATEAATQIGLNAGTWFFRAGREAPILMRLPCGGGLTLGAFHSGEYEGLWSQFTGLKVLYPATPQETFEALVAGFYDRNPCLVLEHKLLYWTKSGDVEFDGDLRSIWRPRRYSEGNDLTIVAFGAMVDRALEAAARSGRSADVWNPLVMRPLDVTPIVESVRKTGRLLVVQECGESQGLGDRVISLLVRKAHGSLKCAPLLVAAPDVPLPFAPELEHCCRPSVEKIVAGIERTLGVG